MRTLLLLSLVACAQRRPVEEAARAALEDFSAPADARSWYLQALYAESLGDLSTAERAMDWAVRLDRGSPWPWLARARFAERQGALEAAIADASAAIERAPELPEARLLLGSLLIQAGRSSEAVAHLERAPPCAVVELLGPPPVPDPLVATWDAASADCGAATGSDPLDGSREGTEEGR